MSKNTTPDAAARHAALVHAIGLQNQGDDAAATAAFRALLAENPNDPVVLYSLCGLLIKADALDEALLLATRGVEVAPGFAPLWFAHAMVLQSAGRREEALRSYERAIAAKPDYTEAMINSGALLREMQRHLPALERFNQVLQIDPNNESALGNCGILLTEFKQSDKAIAMFERLLAINPDFAYGPGLLCYERMHICDWTDFDRLTAQITTGVRAGKRTCKTLGLMALSDSAEDHFRAARIFADQWFPKAPRALWNGEVYAHKRLRIAYVSPDLREHPVGHLMAGVFERHDKARFETFAFSLGIDDGSRLRARMQAAFEHFIDVRGQPARQIAALMREHEIDIAIDLAGFTSDSRIDIFANRPAPVQVTYLGYPGTLGTDYIDYLIADRHVVPIEHQPFYSEQVVYLPDAYLPTDAGIAIAERTPTRAECGLPETGPVLCSFNHDYKIHPTMFAAWMRLLARLPGSVLWLMSRNAFSQKNLRAEAAKHGIAPERLVFAERVPRVEDHLARYRLADVFLDTSPYNAHTTAADALMAGLPVVTFMGGAFPARVAGSLLHAIGLPELVADSVAGYEALVEALVSDPVRMADVKARLAQNKATHPLFDTDRFCRNLEDLLAGLKPQPVSRAAPALAPAPAVASVVIAPEVPALRAEFDAAAAAHAARNWPQAELHLRRYLRAGGREANAPHLLDDVSRGYGLAPGFELVEPAAPVAVTAPKYLLIKAWGYGFWSEVHHVLAQLLVAELTGRTPVIQWGGNSLFRGVADDDSTNAWHHFFQDVPRAAPVSMPTLQALADAGSVYPLKWAKQKLTTENLAKWEGEGSRRAAQYFFARPEPLVVSDFYSTLSSLLPWIGQGSRYHGLSDDEVYAQLFARYLVPAPAVVQQVDAFFNARMAGRAWVAVHARGSDKVHESADLHQTNERYVEFVDRIIELNPTIGVFLLTDSQSLHASFSARYGDRVVATPALRSSTEAGVHLQGHDGRKVGEEVLVDALLATRCDYFVGNMESNVSLAIASLKAWPRGQIAMLGAKSCRSENLFLHRQPAEPATVIAPAPIETCRLCRAPVQHRFDQHVLGGRHRVSYFKCDGCGSLQTERPHWLAEAYTPEAERFDTGKASRTLVNFLAFPRLLEILRVRPDDVCIDFGGGTGLFARLMRDAGVNFHSFDKYGSGEFAGDFKLDALDRRCSVLTLFEVMEHFAEPAEEWARLFATDPDFVIGSTSVFTGQGPEWHYLSPESGQHVFFYSFEAIEQLARQHGRHAYRAGMYFILSRWPIAPERQHDIRAWHGSLDQVCRRSLDQWAQQPFANASRDNQALVTQDQLRRSGRRIVLDGVFFRFNSGISRLWKSVLAEWSASGFGEFVVVVDRARTAPRYPNIRYVDAPLHQYADLAADQALLQAICDRERAGIFVSTYYTTPVTTPAAMMVLDMIPEAMGKENGFDMNDAQWREKHRCIAYADSYLAISDSTARDLVRYCPGVAADKVLTTYCGSDFAAASAEAVASFRERHGITRPYFMTSGSRTDYKNTLLFFKAFERLGDQRAGLAVVCTHAHQLEPELAACIGPAQLHPVVLSDDDLQCAYSGAMALAYPSRYEGFGLPVLEAMACGCPVITCHNSSIPEVGGDAVIYVDPDDIDAMVAAFVAVQDGATRQTLIDRGFERARHFSWARMAREVGQALALRAVEARPSSHSATPGAHS